MVDALGNPLGFLLTGGEAHDLAGADHFLPGMQADMLIADKGFDADERVLRPLAAMPLPRQELLMKLGAARDRARSAWRLIRIDIPENGASFSFSLDREKLRQARSREGCYLLRINLTEDDPAKLWSYYLQLVRVEEAFRNLKGDLAVRPIFHQHEARIEAQIFLAFLAYCLHVTLARRLAAFAPGLTPRSVLAK
ncbi:MAG: transposase [Acetobacteraceae bacterium]